MATLKRVSAGFQGVPRPAWVKRCDNEKCQATYGPIYFVRQEAVDSWELDHRCTKCSK